MNLRRSLRLVGLALLAFATAVGLAAAAPKPAQYVGATTAASPSTKALVLARPAGTGAGDLLLAALQVRRAAGRAVSAPQGWHLVRRDRAGRGRASLTQALYYKVAVAQEPSSYRWQFPRPVPALGAIVAYRGVYAASPVASSSGRASRNVRWIRAPGLKATPAGVLLVGFFGHTGTSTAKPGKGLTERLDRRGGSRGRPLRLQVVDSSSVVKGAKSARLGRKQGLVVGQLVALRAATAAPPPPPPPPPPPAPPPNAPCAGTRAPSGYDHVVWILFENHSYNQVIGSSSAPYFNQLAARCGLATNYSAISHPSLPNYIALTSGSTQGITDDSGPSSHPLNVPSIFSQLPRGASRSLQESMPGNCALSSSGQYAVRHNPQAYYTNVRGDCGSYNVPLGSPPNISARFTFITPNLCSDMHDCAVSTGDTWLARFLPTLLTSSEYRGGRTVVFVTFDEGSGNNQVATLVIARPVHPGARSATAYTHYSLLRTTEELLRLGLIGSAGSATSMRAGFGL